jgi:hypothetical protein
MVDCLPGKMLDIKHHREKLVGQNSTPRFWRVLLVVKSLLKQQPPKAQKQYFSMCDPTKSSSKG